MLSGFQLYFQRRRDQLCEVWEVFPPSQIDREQRRQREVETAAGCVTLSALYFYNNSSYHNYVHKDERYVARTLHTVITAESLLSPPLHHYYQAAMCFLLLNLEEEKPQSLGHVAGIPGSAPPQDALASREARCQGKSHPSQGCKPLRRVQSQQGSELCPSLNITSV